MPTGKGKEGESSEEENKKRSASPAGVEDNDGSDSQDSAARRSRRKRPKVCYCIRQLVCSFVAKHHKTILAMQHQTPNVKTPLNNTNQF